MPQTSRRQFLATTAVGAVGTAGAQENNESDDGGGSDIIRPVTPGTKLASVAAEATQYLIGAVEDVLPFTGGDVGKYDDLEAEETHIAIYKDAKTMSAYDEQVLTNLNNLLEFAPNALYADAKFAALKVHEQGGTLEEAKQAAEQAVKNKLKKSQINLLKHFKLQRSKIITFRNTVQSTEGLDLSTVFTNNVPNEEPGSWDVTEIKKEGYGASLVDGSSKSYNGLKVTSERVDADPITEQSIKVYSNDNVLKVTDPQSDSDVTLFGTEYSAWTKIPNKSDTVVSEVKTLLDNVYSKLDSEEYDTSDLINGTDLADRASNPQSYASAGADLAALNVPLADTRLVIELPEANNGEGQTYEGSLAVVSKEDVELEVGKRYKPEDLPGQVVMTYNYRDPETDELRGAKTILQQPFRITEAITDDGQSRSTVTFSGRNQQTTDTDVDALIKELKQLSETQREIEERQREIVAGGGLQLPDVDLGGNIVPAVVILGGLLLLTRDS